ncbi:MAG TPA: beta-ketoacyl-ACP synthase III [Myxococcales bacterium]|nr:beta-ketoacyl-ACP synthase III [Myxococcales bacterium]
MQRSRIVGTGTYLPERVVTNDDLSQKMGINTTDAWIRERTGIGARRIAAPDEATSDMATAASRKALEMAGTRPQDLDLIICGTVTADMPFPAAACFVQAKLGATKAAAFDVSAACAGSLFALSIADQYIKNGMAQKVLVLGAELLTRITDWSDRSTCVLFGDAAGAMVLVPETRPERGLLSTHLHTDGTQTSILNIPGGGSLKPFGPEVHEHRDQFIKMNGREVYKTAVRALEACSREALQRNGYRPQDVDRVIAHQANLRILEHVMKKLEIPLEKCELNIEEVGNTSSASVPLTLDQANRAGRLKDGDLVLMMAIGGGMAWGSALLKW